MSWCRSARTRTGVAGSPCDSHDAARSVTFQDSCQSMAADSSIDERSRRSQTTVKTLLSATLLLGATALVGSASSVGADAKAARGLSEVDWSYFGGSKHLDRYSPLAQINR